MSNHQYPFETLSQRIMHDQARFCDSAVIFGNPKEKKLLDKFNISQKKPLEYKAVTTPEFILTMQIKTKSSVV